jgi:hypothetical protein
MRSLLQLYCSDADGPMSDFHLLRPCSLRNGWLLPEFIADRSEGDCWFSCNVSHFTVLFLPPKGAIPTRIVETGRRSNASSFASVSSKVRLPALYVPELVHIQL